MHMQGIYMHCTYIMHMQSIVANYIANALAIACMAID